MRKLSTWLTVGSLIVACLIGIMTINVFQDKKKIEKDYQELKSQNDELINETKHVESLNNQISDLKLKLANANGYSDPNSDSSGELSFLQEDWDKIVIESGGEEIEIDSHEIMTQFKNSLHGSVVETNHPYPGGSGTSITSFTFHIYSKGKIYSFHSLRDNFFKDKNEEIFYKSGRDYKQIAKAFVKKPENYPETTMLSEYFHSGMMVGEKIYSYPMLSPFRINSIVSNFLMMEKEEVSSSNLQEDYIEKFTFYYYGKKLYMEIYEDHFHLYNEEGSFEQWYKTDAELIESFFSNLNAG
ncbi:hypothetical protein CIB95_07990 [Lottiidibacillus patelloidae]|uniref:Uncharacterized protein n=1 Tax=Lottiidibacillus patelloidae TaxID=2670334 RepID=A0A263BUH2_9BACI|nr:hypothetical protein [Lottiidibacillus patelloidae]OZM57391.1 hypothetical protein CIB95_07990 [Lottiidibacillus patelloidae]